jgi:hypothetical protein
VTIEGVDYSWARPDPVKLYAAGKRFAVRYVSSSTKLIGGHTKNLSRSEADALHAAGVATVTNWEWTADDWTHGYDTGRLYAQRAANMHADCGGPPDAPIYFSVDRDLGAYGDKSVEACRQYFAGVRSVFGPARTGIYGGRYAVKLAHDEFWCKWFWQTYAWSNISTLGWLPYVHLQQYNNGETVAGTSGIDLDRAMMADYGQWGVDVAFTSTQEAELLTAARFINTYMMTAVWRIAALEDGVDVVGGGASKGQPFFVNKQLKAIMAKVAALPVDPVDEQAVATAVLATLTPAAIAAAIPGGIAQDVADELAARLTG